ncbi:MAG: hypothetical protein M3209_04845 [Acidobacteriota bacterium]|nr:hypothetical protein [Acidobacteriota bacterium]
MDKQNKSENYFNRVINVLPRKIILFILCGVILLVPFPTTVVPEWKVRVVDQNGKPFVGEAVREYWQHYSLESSGHQEERLTDENGYVVFPKRTIWSPLLWRIVSTSLAAVSTLAHGSMGIDAWLMVVGYSTGGGARDYKPGEPLPNEIVLQR